ncbi:hypothetical protein P879_00255 [Paragonimus westermani]|uniref:Uncharacterized protein n=1 Tax=Paragonimus westermani TaxID=34504 RepID=A0A8T0DYN9_9TREM|nr:hypothetical protein P879_00255 [Paragonimus westermani]
MTKRRWQHVSTSTTENFNMMTTFSQLLILHNAKLLAFIFAVFFLSYNAVRVSYRRIDSCQSLLDDGFLDVYKNWHSTDCMIHRYTSRQVSTDGRQTAFCLKHQPKRIYFLGDSRLWKLFQFLTRNQTGHRHLTATAGDMPVRNPTLVEVERSKLCFFLQGKFGVDALTAFKRWTLQSATADGATWSISEKKGAKGCLSTAPTHIIMSIGTYEGGSSSNIDSDLKAYETMLRKIAELQNKTKNMDTLWLQLGTFLAATVRYNRSHY